MIESEIKPKDLQFTVQERAVLYARVSSDDRGKDGRNLQGQLDMDREYAQTKEYNIVAELAEDDRGASGAEIDLPELNKIREMARNGEFDVLIVREIDRLSRNLAKQLVVEEELNRFGVRVEYVIGDYADTPEGRLNKHIRATVAEYEREKIKERMHRGKRLKVQSGNVMVCKKPPFGYRLVPDENNTNLSTLEIDEIEAPIIRKIFELFLEGLTIEGICRRLYDEGIPPPSHFRKFAVRSKTGKWSRTTIHTILKNETYAGVWKFGKYKSKKTPNSDLIRVEVPAIVTAQVFAQVQERLSRNLGRRGRPVSKQFLLSKRVICGECGYKGRVYFVRDGEEIKRGYYVCPSKYNPNLVRTCTQKGFRYEKVDVAVWNWIEGILRDKDRLEETIESEQAKQYFTNTPLLNELTAAKEQIKTLERELESQLEILKDLKKRSRAHAVVLNDIERIEDTLDKLEAHKVKLERRLSTTTLTEEKVKNIQAIAAKVTKGLEVCRLNFEARKAIIDALDVEVRLIREKGEEVAYITCHLGEHPILMSDSVYTFFGNSPKNVP